MKTGQMSWAARARRDTATNDSYQAISGTASGEGVHHFMHRIVRSGCDTYGPPTRWQARGTPESVGRETCGVGSEWPQLSSSSPSRRRPARRRRTRPPPPPRAVRPRRSHRAVPSPPRKPFQTLEHHVHAHLDVFLDGSPVTVPAGIGININNPAVHTFVIDGQPGY